VIRRGEIYEVDFDPVVGHEQAGTRPALVVSVDWMNRRPLVVVTIPGTHGRNATRDYRTNIRVPAAESGLPLETVFFGFQMRALDPTRFAAKPWGRLPAPRMAEVDEALRHVLGLAGR
jgi:mRNA interferase MazF